MHATRLYTTRLCATHARYGRASVSTFHPNVHKHRGSGIDLTHVLINDKHVIILISCEVTLCCLYRYPQPAIQCSLVKANPSGG